MVGLIKFIVDLPIPNLGSYTSKKFEEPTKEIETSTTSATSDAPVPASPPVSRQITAAQQASPSQHRRSQRQSFGVPDSDPWGSPELHRGHSHTSTNGTRPAANHQPSTDPARTTSAFTTTSQSASDVPTSPPTRDPTGGAGLWGSYNNGGADSFRASGLGDGFGETPGGEGDGGNNNDPTGLGAPFIAPRIAPSGPEEVITITSLPEKEGMFLFQHRNYQVTSARRNSKVIRRYSDFAWLLDCLHKRYPFRQLPLLPPKRVASKYKLSMIFFPKGLTLS
jgi:sorting nexin-8